MGSPIKNNRTRQVVRERLQAAEEGNGLEAWRLLCDSKIPKSATVAFNNLMNPTFTSPDPRLCLIQWYQQARMYQQQFGEAVSENIATSQFWSLTWFP